MHAHMGKYEVKGLLGKAVTGSGYLTSDPFGQREVAIKVLDQMPNDPEEARRQLKFFQNEASLAGKLRHPNTVSIYDAGIDKKDGKDLRYQVMELVEGMSLQPHCEPKKLLPVSRAVQIAYKCCKVLDYANGASVGSPAHRSPGADPWRRGDRLPLRHVLAVLHQALTGVRAFGGATAFALMEGILSKDPAAPSAVRRDVPAALDERYASWEDFARALEPMLSEEDATISSLSDVEEYNAMRRLPLPQGSRGHRPDPRGAAR